MPSTAPFCMLSPHMAHGAGRVVKADETYFGMQARSKPLPQRKVVPSPRPARGWDKRALSSGAARSVNSTSPLLVP